MVESSRYDESLKLIAVIISGLEGKRKMRLLVTGGAGFLGSHLVDRLVEGGHEVIVFDNLLTGRVENIGHHFGEDHFEFVKQDVTEYLDISGTVDAVVHFASPASPIDYLNLPIQTLKVGSLGTHKALGLASAFSAGLDIGSVWRPTSASTAGGLLGACEPGWASRGIR
jgi:nucleoside-diphosphate-sugar epimerase